MTFWRSKSEIPKKYHIKADEAPEKFEINTKTRQLIFPESGFGNREISLQKSELAPGAENVKHVHNNEWLGYILDGEGMAWVGDQQFEIKEGDAIFVPPNVPHKWKNTGNKPLIFLTCNSSLGSIFPGTQKGLDDPKKFRAQMLEENEK